MNTGILLSLRGSTLYLVQALGEIYIGVVEAPTKKATVKDLHSWTQKTTSGLICLSAGYTPQTVPNHQIENMIPVDALEERAEDQAFRIIFGTGAEDPDLEQVHRETVRSGVAQRIDFRRLLAHVWGDSKVMRQYEILVEEYFVALYKGMLLELDGDEEVEIDLNEGFAHGTCGHLLATLMT
jgi:hypothetical protein